MFAALARKKSKLRMSCSDDDYKFLLIDDALKSISQRVNLIGIVADAVVPRRSKGTDYVCTLKIVDETHHQPGLSINMFGESMDDLPQIQSAGDIIILNKVTVGSRTATFNKRHSSFGLYEGSRGEGFTPYQVSGKFYPDDHDKKHITRLRESLVYSQVVSGSKNPSLSERKEGDRCTLICKVLHVCSLSKDEWFAYVWDGTDAPPLVLDNKLEDEMDYPLPLQFESYPLAKEILHTFPPLGTILRILPAKGMVEIGADSLVCNRWLKFVNIMFKVQAGLWRAVVMPFTKLIHLSNKDSLVKECERKYAERLSEKWGHVPFWYFPAPSQITVTDHEPNQYVTLREVLTNKAVTGKFSCVVRVMALLPWLATDFRAPNGKYRIRLTLEDPTARIHAFIYAEDGEHFFGKNSSVIELTRMRNRLLGIDVDEAAKEPENCLRNPPWIECCIKSYYLDKNDPWGSRHYRIFDTEVVA